LRSIPIDCSLAASTLARMTRCPSARARSASSASSPPPTPRPCHSSATVAAISTPAGGLVEHVAHDADGAAGGRVDGDQRLAVVVVDVDEEVELA